MSTTPMVVRHHYAGKKMMTKAAHAHLVAHLKYIEHRSRDQERESRDDRRIFDAQGEVINRKDVIGDIMEHAAPGRRDAYFHKVMLSPGPDIPVEDYRQWTRALMHDLEQRHSQKLHWYAVQHHNTDYNHVHIVIAGAGERFDSDQLERVFLTPSDYEFLKERGKEHSEEHHRQLIKETLEEINRNDTTINYEPVLGRSEQ